MGILFLGILALVVMLDMGYFGENRRGIVRRAARPGLVLGAIGFVAGFFGPMLFAPDANQGPCLASSSRVPADLWSD